MRYTIEPIQTKTIQTLQNSGLPAADAEILARSLIAADSCGVSTHGLRMLPSYLSKLQEGAFSNQPLTVLKSTAAFTLVDAHNAVGAVSAWHCASLAVQRAKDAGIHVVFARGCSTFGPAFWYAEEIVKHRMVGIVGGNSPAAMSAYNGLEAMLGTNPLAFACPTKSQGVLLLDMATSVVAKSRIGEAAAKNEKIPFGWAVDRSGEPTDDPLEAVNGFLLPMAGFKGYGLAIMIDVISGLLSGAGYLNQVGKFYTQDNRPMNAGQFFIAMDADKIYEGDFEAEMDVYIKTLRNSRNVRGKTIVVPGDDRARLRQQTEALGLELSFMFVACVNRIMKGRSGRCTRKGLSSITAW